MALRTNLGPLTTVFTPPSECSTLMVSGSDNNYDIAWGFSCTPAPAGDFGVITASTSCYPPGLGSFAALPCGTGGGRGPCPILNSVPFYSPGLSCPQGFTSACTMTRQEGDQPPPTDVLRIASRKIWEQLEIGETAIGCCPSGWVCADDYHHLCHFAPASGAVISGTSFSGVCSTLPNAITVQKSPGTSVDAGYRVQLVMRGSTPSPGQSPRTESPSISTPSQSPTGSAGPPNPGGSIPSGSQSPTAGTIPPKSGSATSSGQSSRTESARPSTSNRSSTTGTSLSSSGGSGTSPSLFTGGAQILIGAVVPIAIIGVVAIFVQ